MIPNQDSASVRISIARFEGNVGEAVTDQLAVEEPLEIRVGFGPAEARVVKPIAITMRTPGNDFELAAGFLFTEGIIKGAGDVDRMEFCGIEAPPYRLQNVVRVELVPEVVVDLKRLERHFFTNSSCGVCGKATIEGLRMQCSRKVGVEFRVAPEFLHGLPGVLREAQAVFDRTGGLHATALFDVDGKMVAMREDVGRHNALDKLIGSQLMAGSMPLGQRVVLVSGRASYELMQKGIMAGVGVMAAVGAPSSLAVELAEEFGVTLVGFLRGGRFNVYGGQERIMA